MTQHRAFRIPLKENAGSEPFKPRYDFGDIGLDPLDFHFFGYIDIYTPPPSKEEVDNLTSDIDASWLDKVVYTQYVPVKEPEEDNTKISLRREMVSWTELPSDIVLKFVSLPDVDEIKLTLFHLSRMLKFALEHDKPTETIIEAIKNL